VLSEMEVFIRKSKFQELWRILKAKDVLIIQRSRSRWLKEGDTNSKFFHKCLKLRASRNAIKALRVNEGWMMSPSDVRRKVVEYLTNHVAANGWERPRMEGVRFDRLSVEENNCLVAPFSLLEIEAVVRESDGNKSPGPDGFNFRKFV